MNALVVQTQPRYRENLKRAARVQRAKAKRREHPT